MDASAKLTQTTDPSIEFKLDGHTLQAQPGESILNAAQRHGVDIPHLCHQDGLRPDGNCRACVVEIEGERTLAPSCYRSVSAGLQVQTRSERALKSQEMVLELLLSDMPDAGYQWNVQDESQQHGELSAWAARLGVTVRPALGALRRKQPASDTSHPAMADMRSSPRKMKSSRGCWRDETGGEVTRWR